MTPPAPTPAPTSTVQAAFNAMPSATRDTLLAIRTMIYDLAADLPVGRIEETLKWGQPSYATPDTNAATPIRLGVTKSGTPAIFTHCQSSVMSDFQSICGTGFTFDGNRALHLPADAMPPLDSLTPLLRAALTYRI